MGDSEEEDRVNQQKQKNQIINQIQSLYSDLAKNNDKKDMIGQDIVQNIQNVDPSQIKKLIDSIDSIDSSDTKTTTKQKTDNQSNK